MTTTDAPLTRGQKRRIQIIEVAAELFNKRGYHETSMDAIAEAVGVRKASLYYHYASKDELLVEIHQDMIELIIEKQETRAQAGDLSPTDQLLAIMTDLIELMESRPGHLRIFFEHFRELPEAVRTDIAAKRDHYRGLLITVLERGRDAGEFEFEDTFLTAMNVLGTCNWTYQWFRPDGPRTAAETAEYFHAQMLRGLAPQPS